jgi:1-acyl-sn-glycerol-3-phosphate acyltransferase
MRRILRIIAAAIFIPLVGISVLLANFFQMLTLFLYPISPKLFRECNRKISGGWFGFLRWTVEVPLRIKIEQYGDTLPRKENAFLIVNHQAMADIPILLTLAARSGRLGDLKWYVKDPLKWCPGIGWGMLFLDCLFVKRNWTADKEKVTATFSRIRKNESPFWVMSFLEGTRSTPSKIKRSQDFGKKKGLPHLEHVLLPRTKGFEATLDGLGEMNKAIYDITIAYDGNPPHLMSFFFGSMDRVLVFSKRYTSWPKTPEEQSAWAVQRFVEKDALLKKFNSTRNF